MGEEGVEGVWGKKRKRLLLSLRGDEGESKMWGMVYL